MDRIIDAAGSSHEIGELRYHHGRHAVSMMPGFCGSPAVVLGAKSPDTLTFSCPCSLALDVVHAVVLASGHRLEVVVTAQEGHRVRATVLDRSDPGPAI